MSTLQLIDQRYIGHSQSGEEGVVAFIFKVLGVEKGLCCEFGAWDGVHLSNTRALMEKGWRGLMIEADTEKFKDLKKTYPDGSNAICVREFVDIGNNSLDKIAKRNGLKERMDFLNIDIDGMDFDIFSSLANFEHLPRVVCVEAHTCHRALDEKRVGPKDAGKDPGQPLGLYVKRAKEMNYRLICFLGTNAFFIQQGEGHEKELPTLSNETAVKQNFKLVLASKYASEFLYKVNLGLEAPYYRFGNPLFSRSSLGIPIFRALKLRFFNHPAKE